MHQKFFIILCANITIFSPILILFRAWRSLNMKVTNQNHQCKCRCLGFLLPRVEKVIRDALVVFTLALCTMLQITTNMVPTHQTRSKMKGKEIIKMLVYQVKPAADFIVFKQETSWQSAFLLPEPNTKSQLWPKPIVDVEHNSREVMYRDPSSLSAPVQRLWTWYPGGGHLVSGVSGHRSQFSINIHSVQVVSKCQVSTSDI